MIKHIATAAIYVENQQAAKTFWTEKVGFEIKRETPMGPNASWLEVGPEGAETALVLYPKVMMAGSESMKPSLVFNCENIQEAYRKMKEKGVKFESEPKEMDWGTYAQFHDEDGYMYLLKG